MVGESSITVVFFTNPQMAEQGFKEVKNTIGIPNNLVCISNTPDIKLN